MLGDILRQATLLYDEIEIGSTPSPLFKLEKTNGASRAFWVCPLVGGAQIANERTSRG